MADQNEVGVFTEDLAYGRVDFVVGKRPGDRLDVTFEGFWVNDEAVPLGRPKPVPGDQGRWIEIGTFPVGEEIEVRWQFRTGMAVPDREIVIGHCPNGRLTRLVRLELRKVEPFEPYFGTFKVIPEKP